MTIYCKGAYHNAPQGLHFNAAGVIEVDDWKAEYLLHDAPENFSRELPAPIPNLPAVVQEKAFDEPTRDKQVKAPARKK